MIKLQKKDTFAEKRYEEKKLLFIYANTIITILTCSFVTSCDRSETPHFPSKKMDRGHLYVKSPRKSFGTIRKDQKACCIFEIKNTGKIPVTISKIDVSCGCIKTELDKKTILPDMANNLTVTINPQKFDGYMNKVIYVNSDADNSLLLLRVKGMISNN